MDSNLEYGRKRITADYNAGRSFLQKLIESSDDPRLQFIAFDAMLKLDIEHAGPYDGLVKWHSIGGTNA